MHPQPATQAAAAPALDTSRAPPRRYNRAAKHVLAWALLHPWRTFTATDTTTKRIDRFASRRAINALCRAGVLTRQQGDGAARYMLSREVRALARCLQILIEPA
jgi:hypothetical protein